MFLEQVLKQDLHFSPENARVASLGILVQLGTGVGNRSLWIRSGKASIGSALEQVSRQALVETCEYSACRGTLIGHYCDLRG